MTIVSRAIRPLLAFALLPLSAPVAAAEPPAAAPARANPDIIPLPLNPIIPAAQRTCAERTPAGLGYTVLRPASGAKPAAADVVLVNYIGYLAATGAVFDQSTNSPMRIADVIPGFAQGLQMLAKTEVARFCIPAALGYGANGSGPIPPNADLVFQIELVDFKTAAEIEAMRKAQPATPPEQ